MQHNFWWFIHNAVAHPLIAVAPLKTTMKFHDWTGKKLDGPKKAKEDDISRFM